ncbi:hypothetical protein ACB092_02G153100 [Castanea dentata]
MSITVIIAVDGLISQSKSNELFGVSVECISLNRSSWPLWQSFELASPPTPTGVLSLNPAHSLFFSNLDLTCPLSLHGWSFKLCRSKPHSESSISSSLDMGRRGLVGLFW